MRSTIRRNGETVAGVQLNNNTGSTKYYENRITTLRNGETVAGVELNNNTGSTKQSER